MTASTLALDLTSVNHMDREAFVGALGSTLLRQRCELDSDAELAEALRQIATITRLRLEAKLGS
jgi:2-oxo-4-hydroxy-4-carboxy--5-ureidoimidazoline (OHCU) decarboxylase